MGHYLCPNGTIVQVPEQPITNCRMPSCNTTSTYQSYEQQRTNESFRRDQQKYRHHSMDEMVSHLGTPEADALEALLGKYNAKVRGQTIEITSTIEDVRRIKLCLSQKPKNSGQWYGTNFAEIDLVRNACSRTVGARGEHYNVQLQYEKDAHGRDSGKVSIRITIDASLHRARIDIGGRSYLIDPAHLANWKPKPKEATVQPATGGGNTPGNSPGYSPSAAPIPRVMPLPVANPGISPSVSPPSVPTGKGSPALPVAPVLPVAPAQTGNPLPPSQPSVPSQPSTTLPPSVVPPLPKIAQKQGSKVPPPSIGKVTPPALPPIKPLDLTAPPSTNPNPIEGQLPSGRPPAPKVEKHEPKAEDSSPNGTPPTVPPKPEPKRANPPEVVPPPPSPPAESARRPVRIPKPIESTYVPKPAPVITGIDTYGLLHVVNARQAVRDFKDRTGDALKGTFSKVQALADVGAPTANGRPAYEIVRDSSLSVADFPGLSLEVKNLALFVGKQLHRNTGQIKTHYEANNLNGLMQMDSILQGDLTIIDTKLEKLLGTLIEERDAAQKFITDLENDPVFMKDPLSVYLLEQFKAYLHEARPGWGIAPNPQIIPQPRRGNRKKAPAPFA